MGTEMRCDKCCHWDKPDQHDWEAESSSMRWCRAVRERWLITDEASRNIKLVSDHTALAAARAYVQDGSQYQAEFITGPDFFCALFEKVCEQPQEIVAPDPQITLLPRRKRN
jgi:hypothetical protein